MENKSNKYNRIIATILMIFIALIIILNFLLYEKQFKITNEIIVCLLLLVILCLADSFDNFSIPKIISLSKNVKEIKEDNDKLKEINLKLMEQMINIKNTNNQIMYMPGTINTVGSSNIEDIVTKQNEEPETISNDNNTEVSLSEQRKSQIERYKYRRNLDVILLKKAIMDDKEKFEIQYDVKVTNNKFTEENMMRNETRFDALKSNNEKSVFYEVKIGPMFMDFDYQLHYKLKMVEIYGKINSTDSKLVLIIPNIDNELEKIIGNNQRFAHFRERIAYRFEPAINKGLLEIKEVNILKSEIDEYIDKKGENVV